MMAICAVAGWRQTAKTRLSMQPMTSIGTSTTFYQFISNSNYDKFIWLNMPLGYSE